MAVAGYAKVTGKPMIAIVHNMVGLQHASMAIFNAYIDRVPILVLGGTGPMNTKRRRPHRLDSHGVGTGQSSARLRQVG